MVRLPQIKPIAFVLLRKHITATIMTDTEIITQRLYNQHISVPKFNTPQEVVTSMLAMQAQEYAMARWSIGLRLINAKDSDVEKAFNEGAILRTHVMRPTWHFVSPADIRWLLALTAPRVHAFNAYQYRKYGLDSHVFTKCNDIIIRQLEGRKHLTRTALNVALQQQGIITDTIGLSCIMMQAELDGIICSGPREGKQFTYALIDERVPHASPLSKEEALSEMAHRYFTSRGPATIQDFVWWSGLTMKEARVGVSNLAPYFIHKKVEGQEYIYAPINPEAVNHPNHSLLLPYYDEYGIAYKNRDALFLPKEKIVQNMGETFPFSRVIVLDGKIVGSWQCTIRNKSIEVEIAPYYEFSEHENSIINAAVQRFKNFIGDSDED